MNTRPSRTTGVHEALDNQDVAERLEELAGLLEDQDANPFRVRAYRTAAETVRGLPRPVAEILHEQGTSGLTRLRGIGDSLARTIEQLATTARVPLLQRLRGDAAGADVFTTVPGIGPELAHRIHEELGIESLAELETAAHDGRLERVHGMGRRRVRGVSDSLAGRFHHWSGGPPRRPSPPTAEGPPVAELLDVDREYREKAEHDRLPRIAPRKFNPTGVAWLPILHAERGDRHYTALWSNTARAHELGTTHDWVVVYRDDHGGHGQWTVVTARLGSLRGKRIVRGRERECEAHYRSAEELAPAVR